MGALVEVVTWGTVPWEFANFTDSELATAIRSSSRPEAYRRNR